MPQQTFPIASFANGNSCCAGWPEAGFGQSLGERWLLSAEEIDNARERDDHVAAPGTKVRNRRPSVRALDNILVKSLFKVLIASLCCVNKFSSIKPVTYDAFLAA